MRFSLVFIMNRNQNPDRPGNFLENTFLGGFVKQATGVVDRVAGENTRIQLEKGVMNVAESGFIPWISLSTELTSP